MAGKNVRMHAVRQGRGQAVVLLHGWACSSAVWEAVVGHLGGGHETVAFDLPGFGASERIEGSFSLDDLAAEVDHALAASGINDAVVIGHSMGGMVAQHLYARSPGRVAGLVLCGTTSAPGAPYLQTTLQLKELIVTQGAPALAAAMGPGLFGAAYRGAHASLVEEFVDEVAACDEGALTAALDAITHFDLTEQLAQISVPCAVVVGDADPFLEDCRLLDSSIGGSSLTVVEGVGHMEPMESPGEVAAAIEHVVHRVESARSGR